MYAVVGCSACSHLWIIEGRSKTTQCPRCGSRRPFEKRKRFVECEDVDHAREVRASMLANRQGEGEAFAAVDSFADLESHVADGVVSDVEYLEEAGLDAEAITAAGERNQRGPNRSGSKKAVVERALETLEQPTKDEIVEYASARGISRSYVERALEKLRQQGVVSETDGRYRSL